MNTPTPGPWYVYNSPDVNFGINGMYGGVVLFCGSATHGVHGRTPGEAQANANLLAAAPELLEALEGAAGWTRPDGSPCWCYEPPYDDQGNEDDAHGTACLAARAAVKKARGQ